VLGDDSVLCPKHWANVLWRGVYVVPKNGSGKYLPTAVENVATQCCQGLSYASALERFFLNFLGTHDLKIHQTPTKSTHQDKEKKHKSC
jgi:hypothetical protein